MIDKDPKDIFADMNVSKILVAMLDVLGTVEVPTQIFMNANNEDKELQVDYNADNQTFTFKLKVSDGSGTDSDQLITDFE